MLISDASTVVSHVASRGAASAARAVTPPTTGSGSSSLSSLSDDQWEFRELVRRVDEARQCYFDAAHEVGWLERCLDPIGVALAALERETAMRRRRPSMPRPASWVRALFVLSSCFGIRSF